MNRRYTSLLTAVAASALLAGCNSAQSNPTPTKAEAPKEPDKSAESEADQTAPYGRVATKVEVERVGKLRVAPTLRDAINQTIEVSDSNRDGQLAKAEARDALEFMIGGFFFRVDEDGDGKLTPEERSSTQADFAAQYPMVRTLFQVFDEQQVATSLIDTLEGDGTSVVTLKTAKRRANDVIEALYTAVDSDSNDQITREEVEQALANSAANVANNTFDFVDANNDGSLTQGEFKQALSKPLEELFTAADLDRDGKLSKAEAEALMSMFGDGLRRISSTAYIQISKATDLEP